MKGKRDEIIRDIFSLLSFKCHCLKMLDAALLLGKIASNQSHLANISCNNKRDISVT